MVRRTWVLHTRSILATSRVVGLTKESLRRTVSLRWRRSSAAGLRASPGARSMSLRSDRPQLLRTPSIEVQEVKVVLGSSSESLASQPTAADPSPKLLSRQPTADKPSPELLSSEPTAAEPSPELLSSETSAAKSSRTVRWMVSQESARVEEDGDREEAEKAVSLLRILRVQPEKWWLIALGSIASMLNGTVFPVFAILFGEVLEVFSRPADMIFPDLHQWAGLFLMLGVASAIFILIKVRVFSGGLRGAKSRGGPAPPEL